MPGMFDRFDAHAKALDVRAKEEIAAEQLAREQQSARARAAWARLMSILQGEAPTREPAEEWARRRGMLGGFDPESADYDMKAAIAAGLRADETGHWPSRDPQTGLLLKGRGHPTWSKTEAGEEAAGMEIYRGEDGRYYSRPRPRIDGRKPTRGMLPLRSPTPYVVSGTRG